MSNKLKDFSPMSNESLEQVAGGSHAQNQQLFAVIKGLDKSEYDFINKSVPEGDTQGFAVAVQGAMRRIMKEQGIDGTIETRDGGSGYTNTYTVGGKEMSHDDFVSFMLDKLNGNDF